MDNHLIYLHGEGTREPKATEIPPHATVEEIIVIYQQQFQDGGKIEEIMLFVEEEGEPKDRRHHHTDAGIHHRHHVHCHRCRQVDAIIFYNGDDKSFRVAPSMTIKSVFQKAIHAFGISESDAGDYVLKLDDGVTLRPSEHIGSFAKPPRCHVKLSLTAIQPVNG
jgi:hypothetical protein